MKKNTPRQSKKAALFGPQDMNSLVRRSGIELSDSQLDRLWSYHTLLREFNAALNLTRIHSFENMVLKLYVDSILPGTLITLPSPLMDLGSGAGMPGIPLKIVFPRVNIVLAESRAQRTGFMKTVIETLKLEDISIVDASVTSKYETPMSGVITRAVEHMEDTLERISGCLVPGGQAIFMKGPNCDSEIQAAVNRFGREYRLRDDIAYEIPHTPHARRLVVFERIGEPPRHRREAAMQKHLFRRIESEENAVFKSVKKLLTGRGIKKHRGALVSGSKTIKDMLRLSPELCEAWITTAQHESPPDTVPAHAAWYEFSPQLFQAIDVWGTDAPILLIKTPPIEKWRVEDGVPHGCSLFLPFQDPENVGAVIRSAVAFGVKDIILLAECAHPYHPKSLRASGGAVFQARLLEGPSLRDLPRGLQVVPLSAEGSDIAEYVFPENFGLLPGIEGPGLPAHLRENAVSVPISGDVESLNAATATAIALFLWKQSAKGDETA